MRMQQARGVGRNLLRGFPVDLAIFNGQRRRSPAYIGTHFGLVEPRGIL